MVNTIREYGIRNAWNRFIRSSLLNRSIRSASNRKSTLETAGHPRALLEDPAPAGRPATDCDILGYPRPRKRGIIPGYEDHIVRVTPATGFIISRFVGRASEPWERGSVAVGSLGNLRASTSRINILSSSRKDCGSPKTVAEER